MSASASIIKMDPETEFVTNSNTWVSLGDDDRSISARQFADQRGTLGIRSDVGGGANGGGDAADRGLAVNGPPLGISVHSPPVRANNRAASLLGMGVASWAA